MIIIRLPIPRIRTPIQSLFSVSVANFINVISILPIDVYGRKNEMTKIIKHTIPIVLDMADSFAFVHGLFELSINFTSYSTMIFFSRREITLCICPPIFKIIIEIYFHKRLQLFMVCGTPDPKNYKKLYKNMDISFTLLKVLLSFIHSNTARLSSSSLCVDYF